MVKRLKNFWIIVMGKKDNYRWYVNMKLFQLLSEIALESDHEKIKRRDCGIFGNTLEKVVFV